MFDIGWSELLVIAVVAILVVGPRDLPRLMRTVGQWMAKARRMARDLQSQFDAAVREAELDDVRKEMTDLGRMNPVRDVKEAVKKPIRSVGDDLKRTASEVERQGDPRTPAKPAPKPAAPQAAEAPPPAEPQATAEASASSDAERKRAATGS